MGDLAKQLINTDRFVRTDNIYVDASTQKKIHQITHVIWDNTTDYSCLYGIIQQITPCYTGIIQQPNFSTSLRLVPI